MPRATVQDPEREAVRAAIEQQQAAVQDAIEAEQRAAEARRAAAAAATRVDELAVARERKWAERVMRDYAADEAAVRKRLDAAWNAFQVAASTGSADPLAAYLAWVRAGVELNRLYTRWRVARGEGTGHAPPFGNVSSYPEALAHLVAGAASRLLSQSQDDALAEQQAVREGIRSEDDGLAHRDGCPRGRTETFASEIVGRAATRRGNLPSSRPHAPATVTRCLRCGAERVEGQQV